MIELSFFFFVCNPQEDLLRSLFVDCFVEVVDFALQVVATKICAA